MSVSSKKRLDVWLVEKDFAPSRAKAQELIDEDCIRIDGKTPEQISASLPISDDFPLDKIHVDPGLILKFVSRAGRKLESYLLEQNLNLQGLRVLDLGQSTGGFSDCAERYGAELVVGIDVGQGQLHPSLVGKHKIHSIEGLHLKDLGIDSRFLHFVGDRKAGEVFDLTVCDLSFISTLAHLDLILKWSPKVLLLIKPQFELGPQALNKKGLVQDDKMISDLERRLRSELELRSWRLSDWRRSQLKGKDGNQEYFAYATQE